MKGRAVVTVLILIIIFGSFLINGGEKDTEDVVVQGTQSEVVIEDNNVPSLETKVKKAGAVDIEATPIQLEPGKKVVIELSLNTHSVELDYDYTKISYLEDNLGNKYKALKWSGEAGGHHLGGTLSFEKLQQNAKSAVLKISGIDDQDVLFEWEL